VDLQICVNRRKAPETKMRMLRVAKRPPTTLSGVIGSFPTRVVQEHAQVCEVVSIQMLLLLTEWCELSRCGILVPGAVTLLGFCG